MMFMRAMGLLALPTWALLRQSSVSARKAFRQNSCLAAYVGTCGCYTCGCSLGLETVFSDTDNTVGDVLGI